MNELSRHIEILLLDNDCVIVPGFGGFMAHHRPAEYIEEAGMFYPPQRTLGFNPQLKLNDSLLAQAYVEAYDISYPEAVKRIDSEVEEIKQTIVTSGSYEFHGIGIIRLLSTGRYDFEPCTAGLLTPELYALNSFAFDRICGAPATAEIPVTPSVTRKEADVQKETDTQNETEDIDSDEEERYNTIEIRLHTLRNILAAAMILLFFVFSSIPAGIGSNKVITCSVIDTKLITAFMKESNTLNTMMQTNVPKETRQAADTTTNVNNSREEAREEKNGTSKNEKHYTIVLASKVTKSGAEEFVAKLKKAGYGEARVQERGTMRKVIYGNYTSEAIASDTLKALRKANDTFADGWISRN